MSDGIFGKYLIKKYAIALAVTVAISLITLFISALIILMIEDPDPYYRTAAYISMTVSAIISGGITSKIVGVKSAAPVIGCVMSIILFVISLIYFDGTDSPLLSLILHISYVAMFFLGGIILDRKKNNKKRRRRRKK